MNQQIPKGEIVDDAGAVVSKFSGCIAWDSKQDRTEGYGVADAVRAVVAGINDRGRGLSLRFNVDGKEDDQKLLPIRVRDVSIKTRALWFHVVEVD